MIKVVVNGVIASATVLQVLTAGMVKGRAVQFEFTPEWNLLNKTAVFTNGTETRIVPEYKWVNSDTVDIPPEVLAVPHQVVRCGVYGINSDSELVIPTLWAELGRVFPSASPGEYQESVPPTPNTWDDLQNQIGVLSKLTTKNRSNLVEAINELAELGGSVDRDAVQKMVEECIDESIHSEEFISELVSLVMSGISLQSKTVTPNRSVQDIEPDEGYYALAKVTVNPIPYSEVSNSANGVTVTIAF